MYIYEFKKCFLIDLQANKKFKSGRGRGIGTNLTRNLILIFELRLKIRLNFLNFI
jgi:hypothetical protein